MNSDYDELTVPTSDPKEAEQLREARARKKAPIDTGSGVYEYSPIKEEQTIGENVDDESAPRCRKRLVSIAVIKDTDGADETMVPTSDPLEAEDLELHAIAVYESDRAELPNRLAEYRTYWNEHCPFDLEDIFAGIPRDLLFNGYRLRSWRDEMRDHVRTKYASIRAHLNSSALTPQDSMDGEADQFARWVFPFTYFARNEEVRPYVWILSDYLNVVHGGVFGAVHRDYVDCFDEIDEPWNKLQTELHYWVDILVYSSQFLILSYGFHDFNRLRILYDIMLEALECVSALAKLGEEYINELDGV